jgi:hypothetical protein
MASQYQAHLQASAQTRRRVWTFCAIVAFLIILLPLATFVLWSYRYSSRVTQKLAEIAQRGQPISASELNSLYLPTPEEDVTDLWRKGFKSTLEPHGQQWFTRLYRNYEKHLQYQPAIPLPSGIETWSDFSLAEEYLQEFRAVHDLFHEAARRGGRARWRIDYNEFDRPLRHVDYARRCYLLLKMEFYVQARRGDAATCAKCLKTMLALRNALIHEPCLYANLAADHIDMGTLEVLAQSLNLLPYSDQDLLDLQAQIRSREIIAGFKRGMICRRAEGYSAMKKYRSIGEESPWTPAMSFDIDFYLEAMTEYIEALELPPANALQKFEAIDARIAAKADKSKMQFSLAYSSLFLQQPQATRLSNALAAKTSQQAADAAIACELYRREHKKLPPTLETLVPKYLPTVPTDPFSGKPMIYKVEDSGFTIYSLGKNKTDDGGKLDSDAADIGLFFPIK